MFSLGEDGDGDHEEIQEHRIAGGQNRGQSISAVGNDNEGHVDEDDDEEEGEEDEQETPTKLVPGMNGSGHNRISDGDSSETVSVGIDDDFQIDHDDLDIDGDDADFQSHYSFDPSEDDDDDEANENITNFPMNTMNGNLPKHIANTDGPGAGNIIPQRSTSTANISHMHSNSIGNHRPFFHSTSSLPGPNAFAPPFYNRPPTPLPPSPSLTSLLRPPFSTTTSRPTTPDSSDVETPNDTEAAVAKSARTATTVPSASPKVPTYEYYGFVLYLASSLAFLIYLLWSYLPSPFLHQLGIYYYPNRWWSLAIPSFLVMTLVYIYIALASYNTGYLTLPMQSIENIVDEAANIAVIDSKGRLKKGGSEKLNPESLAACIAAQRDLGKYATGGSLALGNGLDGFGSESGQYSQFHHHHQGSQASLQSFYATHPMPTPPLSRRLDWRGIWNEGTDAVMDVPIGGVCEILYGEGRDRSDEGAGGGDIGEIEYVGVEDGW